jgi:hypothetical protein
MNRQTDRPAPLSPRGLERQLLSQLAAAAVSYDDEVAYHGDNPHLAAARLKLAAKAYAKAAREAGMLP